MLPASLANLSDFVCFGAGIFSMGIPPTALVVIGARAFKGCTRLI
jgi:hypothetical protein